MTQSIDIGIGDNTFIIQYWYWELQNFYVCVLVLVIAILFINTVNYPTLNTVPVDSTKLYRYLHKLSPLQGTVRQYLLTVTTAKS